MKAPVVVVGGGVAGLVASIYAAQTGRPVTLLESVSELGGRARTREEHGFCFNLGPHALYKGSVAAEVLRELGIELAGRDPSSSGALALYDDTLHALPAGFVSLLSTGLLRLPEKLEAARFLAGLARLDASAWDGVPLDDTLAQLLRHERVRALLRALVRVSSYTNAPSVHSGGAALRQLQLSLAGVRYLDHGWASLVAALRDVATRSGVSLRTATRVKAVDVDDAVHGVRLASGEVLPASSVVLAMGPAEAAALVRGAEGAPDPGLVRHAESLVPVRAACLDVALSSLPSARARFLLGIDQPFYFSVHTPTAKLAPGDGALIHVARYLAPNEDTGRDGVRAQLEGLLDRLQPGWRGRVVAQHFARELRVSHALPLAANGGLAGRPGSALPGRRGLYLAGDWVGGSGQLVDASFASGREAGCLAAAAAHPAAAAA